MSDSEFGLFLRELQLDALDCLDDAGEFTVGDYVATDPDDELYDYLALLELAESIR